MSAKLTGQVWELELPHKLQAVLLALADNAHDDGTNCYPGVDYLAWKTGYDRRNVQRILRQLEETRLIVSVANAEGGRGRGLEYRIDISKGTRKRPWAEVRDELRRDKQKRAAECHPLSDLKADNLSPFAEGERAADHAQKGGSPDAKGGNSSLKGGIYAARTIKNQGEPTTEPSLSARSAQAPAPESEKTGGSKFTKEVRRAYQAARGLNDGWLYRSADGRYDDLIGDWQRARSSQAVEQSLRAKERPRVALREALLHVKSVLRVNPDTDFEGLIRSIDCDDGVRAELRRQEAGLRPAPRASP